MLGKWMVAFYVGDKIYKIEVSTIDKVIYTDLLHERPIPIKVIYF